MQDRTLEVVGGGLAEWPSGTGPRGETVAPCAFVDAAAAPELLELPALFHSDPPAWRATGTWIVADDDVRFLRIEIPGPAPIIANLVFRGPRRAPFIAAVERAGGLYVCPTTASRGLDARLARDASFPVDLRRE